MHKRRYRELPAGDTPACGLFAGRFELAGPNWLRMERLRQKEVNAPFLTPSRHVRDSSRKPRRYAYSDISAIDIVADVLRAM